MAQLAFAKVAALPGVLAANTLYAVAGAEANLFDLYLSDSTGSSARHIISKTEIQAMVTGNIADFTNIRVFADIAARDAVTLDRNVISMVVDASADATVTTGAAMYIYDADVDTWTKISEVESMDLNLTWEALLNKPTSSVAAIDDAVAKAHVHANKAVLDDLADDGAGVLKYKGAYVGAALTAVEW